MSATNGTATNTTAPPVKICDWRIEIYDCIQEEMWVAEVVISLITNALLTITGAIIFSYRYKNMWAGLFVNHAGVGLRPLPVDCLLLFWGISTFLRALHALLLLTDAFSTYWQRELMQEIGWTFLCIGAVLYLVGIVYTIPVSYTSGTDGMISLGQVARGSSSDKNRSAVGETHVLYMPTPEQLNIFMAALCLWPMLTSLPSAIISGINKDHGNAEKAAFWTGSQYVAYWIFDWTASLISAYYGIHFMLILRSSMSHFTNRSGQFYSSGSNPTRKAFHRLKYTMAYIFFLSFISGPGWGIYGIRYAENMAKPNIYSLFVSGCWYITGPQPLIAVCQYVLAKRIYQHYTGRSNAGGAAQANGIVTIGSASQSSGQRSAGANPMDAVLMLDRDPTLDMNFALDMNSTKKGIANKPSAEWELTEDVTSTSPTSASSGTTAASGRMSEKNDERV